MSTETANLPQVFLDDIADKPPVIDEGKLVLVEVGEAAVRFGKESGEPYLQLNVRVVDDPEDEGAPMIDRIPLPIPKKDGESDKAYKKRIDRRCYRLKLASVAFGIKLGGGKTPDQLAEAFVSRRAWCRTKLETDQRGAENSRPDAYYAENAKPEE